MARLRVHILEHVGLSQRKGNNTASVKINLTHDNLDIFTGDDVIYII